MLSIRKREQKADEKTFPVKKRRFGARIRKWTADDDQLLVEVVLQNGNKL